MKGTTAVIGSWRGREAAALIRDGELDDLLVEAPEDRIVPGTVFRGIAERPVKNQGGMFVRLPGGSRGFLRQTKGVSAGGALLVQVTGFAEPGKAPPMTTRLTLKGRNVIVTPDAPGINVSRQIRDTDRRDALEALGASVALPDRCGAILRSNAESAEDGEIEDELQSLAKLAGAILADRLGNDPERLLDGDGPQRLAWRDWSDVDDIDTGADAFSRHGLPEMLEAVARPVVPIGAGDLWIEETRALVAVDVNTGGDGSMAAGLKANIAMARALPRALRLRGLGGQIVIDAAPAPKRDRRQIETALKSALRADPIETIIAGWTPLGHLELQRRRERMPISELFR